MTKTLVTNMNNVFRYKEIIFIFLISAISASLCAYIYFLHDAIANVVERENIVKKTRILSTDVSELETKYFSVKSKINIELAHEKGFQAAKNTSFISKKSVTAMVTHNEL
jgi:hypothetical protein